MKNTTALILIDIQTGLEDFGYYGTERNNPEAEQNAAKVLEFFRSKNWPVFHVKHNSTNSASPLFPGTSGNEIVDLVKPKDDEPVYGKNVNSAFIGTNLERDLKATDVQKVVIVGLTAEHCISTSVRMSANLGFETILVGDATASFDKQGDHGQHYPAQLVYEIALANLKDEFARIVSAKELIEELS